VTGRRGDGATGRSLAIPDLVSAALRGEVRALARLLTVLEGDWEAGAGEAMSLLTPHTGRAHVIGVTGPPGAGKSTLVDRLVTALREEVSGDNAPVAPSPRHPVAPSPVAVLAFDPSSPFTGGALLGDRIRMGGRIGDPGVYIRSVANRAHSGGLSRTASRLVTALDAAGYGTILMETVGAGQSEVAVAALAQTVLVVLAPGFGDEIQALKAGILETADLFVVNKADLPGADRVAAALRAEAPPRGGRSAGLAPSDRPVLLVSAATGAGIPELVAALRCHASERNGGEGQARRRLQASALLEEAVREALWRRFARSREAAIREAADRVARFGIDPEGAAHLLLEETPDVCQRPPSEQR
jgi:LAO/AO transport system kinase